MSNLWIYLGVLVSVIGIIVSVIIYYIQKGSKKQKVKKEITDIIKRDVQKKEQISVSYIGSIVGTKCKEHKIKKIETTDIIEGLILEYSAIKSKNAQQIVEELIALRAKMAVLYIRDNTNVEIAKSILRNEGTRASQKELLEKTNYVLNSFDNNQNDVNELANN